MKTRVAIGAVVLVCTIVLIGWIDGGEEPLRTISQPIELRDRPVAEDAS